MCLSVCLCLCVCVRVCVCVCVLFWPQAEINVRRRLTVSYVGICTYHFITPKHFRSTTLLLPLIYTEASCSKKCVHFPHVTLPPHTHIIQRMFKDTQQQAYNKHYPSCLYMCVCVCVCEKNKSVYIYIYIYIYICVCVCVCVCVIKISWQIYK